MTQALANHVDAPLIEGEDPGTMRAADARRWIEIYSRLIEFKDELLVRVRARTSENGNGGRHDLQADEQVVLVEMARLRGRLAFWQRRHGELAPVDLNDNLGIISATGDVVPLTRREVQLLRFLLDNPGRFFDTRTLAAKAWNDSRLASEQVRTYVVRLRRRLHEAQLRCDIQSERRRGYALVFDPSSEARLG